MIFLNILFILNCQASTNSPQNLQPEFRKLFSNYTKQIVGEKNKQKKWQLIENFKKVVTDFETRHDKEIGTKTRMDISNFLVLYWPNLPSQSDFKMASCPQYKQMVYTSSNANTASELNEIATHTIQIIDALCNK